MRDRSCAVAIRFGFSYQIKMRNDVLFFSLQNFQADLFSLNLTWFLIRNIGLKPTIMIYLLFSCDLLPPPWFGGVLY